MIQTLKECYKIEQDVSESSHYTIDEMAYAVAPLYKRGLINVKKQTIENKSLYCIFFTQAGRAFVENLNRRK